MAHCGLVEVLLILSLAVASSDGCIPIGSCPAGNSYCVGGRASKPQSPTLTWVKANNRIFQKTFPCLKKDLGGDGPFWYSPVGLGSALATLYLAASNETASELEGALQMSGTVPTLRQDAELALKLFSNASEGWANLNMWLLRKGINVSETYRAKAAGWSIQHVDFANATSAEEQVNSELEGLGFWRLFEGPPHVLHSSMQMVFINQVRYSLPWARGFNASVTMQGSFRVSESKIRHCKMMHQTGEHFLESSAELDARILALPYDGGRMFCLFFLPNEASGFDLMEEKFPNFNFSNFHPALKISKISIPKISSAKHMVLNEALKSMGVRTAFDQGKANFSRLTEGDQGLYLSAIIHAVSLEVPETGTDKDEEETSAASDKPHAEVSEFRLDRPFLFAVMDNWTKAVVIAGKISDIPE